MRSKNLIKRQEISLCKCNNLGNEYVEKGRFGCNFPMRAKTREKETFFDWHSAKPSKLGKLMGFDLILTVLFFSFCKKGG